MMEAAITPSETLWQKIRDEAQRAAAADPIFGRALGGLIFDHDDFTGALSDLIGRRLGDSAAERARFTTFSRDAFNGQPNLIGGGPAATCRPSCSAIPPSPDCWRRCCISRA